MKYKLKSELPALLVAVLPLIYLLTIWSSLPDIVPIHWNLEGAIDDWAPKVSLLVIPFLLPISTYLIFLLIPLIDPKRKGLQTGSKLTKLKFALTFVMAVLALVILRAAKEQALNPNFIFMITGALYAVLGNFFATIKPNYFMGIRTPWTLDNEDNWKQTHRFAGKLWLASGILIILISLFADAITNLFFFLSLTGLMVIIPALYSFSVYRQSKKTIDK